MWQKKKFRRRTLGRGTGDGFNLRHDNAIIMAAARVYFSMSRLNVSPRFIGNVHPRFHTPAGSLVAQGFWSVALLFSGTFDTLIFVTWIFHATGA